MVRERGSCGDGRLWKRTAVALPVDVGARLSMPERLRRRSFFFWLGMSTSDCVPVILCTVVIIPETMPSFSCMTLITGAMQLVVHDAAVQMTCESFNLSSLTPTTTLSTDGSLTGAETTTRFTPQTSRYGLSASVVRKTPSHAMTSSTPAPAQSTLVKSSSSLKPTFVPLTVKHFSPCASQVLPRQGPCTESN